MSTVLTRPSVQSDRKVSGLRLDPVGHRRRPALAVGSLALVVACVAVFVSVYLKAGNQISVLAIARSVPEGQALKADDLMAVRISGTAAITTVPATGISAVLGRRAAERLERDTLLSPNELMTSFSPPVGDSIVGVAAKESQLPASGVVPGETVDLIFTGAPGQPDTSISPLSTATPSTNAGVGTSGGVPITGGIILVSDATVLETVPSTASPGSNDADVSVLLPTTLAPVVASASAAGQIALVVVAPGS